MIQRVWLTAYIPAQFCGSARDKSVGSVGESLCLTTSLPRTALSAHMSPTHISFLDPKIVQNQDWYC